MVLNYTYSFAGSCITGLFQPPHRTPQRHISSKAFPKLKAQMHSNLIYAIAVFWNQICGFATSDYRSILHTIAAAFQGTANGIGCCHCDWSYPLPYRTRAARPHVVWQFAQFLAERIKSHPVHRKYLCLPYILLYSVRLWWFVVVHNIRDSLRLNSASDLQISYKFFFLLRSFSRWISRCSSQAHWNVKRKQ